ncbi:MAG: DUF559 domain-containing protein [Phycisphaeraceae bacterium]
MSEQGPRLSKKLKQYSRELRKEAPIPERILWGLLRNRQIGGLKFRRQHPIGPFIADFCCIEVMLIVELDGLTHVGRAAEDQARTAHLESLGYQVLRVTNDDLLGSPEAVVNAIARAAGLDW